MIYRIKYFLDKLLGFHESCPCYDLQILSFVDDKLTGIMYDGISYTVTEDVDE
jgi:hypothetical protein